MNEKYYNYTAKDIPCFWCYKKYKLKNEDAKLSASPFPKLPLEISKRIVYNHHRNNQRIFALSDDCYRKLINKVYELHRLSPMGVGGSQFTFYGDCQDM